MASPGDYTQHILDWTFDAWLLADICVQLFTAVPIGPVDLAVDRRTIWSNFFWKKFWLFYLPALGLYIAEYSGAPIWVSRHPSRLAPTPLAMSRALIASETQRAGHGPS